MLHTCPPSSFLANRLQLLHLSLVARIYSVVRLPILTMQKVCNSSADVMRIFSPGTATRADLFVTAPIPSHRVFPYALAVKCHSASKPGMSLTVFMPIFMKIGVQVARQIVGT